MFGRGGDDGAGGKKKAKGLDTKLVAALKKLDGEINKKVEFFFKKTCELYQQKGYTFKVKLLYDNEEIWKSGIEPGDGAPGNNEDWYMCPIKLAEIRSKSDLTMTVRARYQPPPDLFSPPSRWMKITFSGAPVKPYGDWELPEKDMYTNNWERIKDKFLILVGGIHKAPKVIKDLNGRHDFTVENKLINMKIGKNVLKQKDRKGPNYDYGNFEAFAPGWFGETFTKYIKDWGTGCTNDINDQIKKLRQVAIDKHEDLELFADNPKVVEFMNLADKAGTKLCTSMTKAYKIIQLFDQGNAKDAKALMADYELELKAAKKAFREELSQFIANLK